MKLLITTLITIFISFGISAKQICKIKPSDIPAYQSFQQKFDPNKSFAGKVRSLEESNAWQKKYTKFVDVVKEKKRTFYFDEVIKKKCIFGDILVVTHFISYEDLERYQSNPYWLDEYFNNMITRVCDRGKNIRQITKETYVFQNKKGIQHFLECIYVKEKLTRKDLNFYKPSKN
jgi:hypothetical protein